MARLTNAQIAKLSPAERKKRQEAIDYKKAYHAKRKAEHEGTKQTKRQYHARKKGQREGVQAALSEVLTLVAELEGAKQLQSKIETRLTQILA